MNRGINDGKDLPRDILEVAALLQNRLLFIHLKRKEKKRKEKKIDGISDFELFYRIHYAESLREHQSRAI